jgi:hypothetical protein
MYIIQGLTVTFDSYFWSKYPVWPEFQGLYFNIYEGKSSEWGVRLSLAILLYLCDLIKCYPGISVPCLFLNSPPEAPPVVSPSIRARSCPGCTYQNVPAAFSSVHWTY